MRIVKLPAKVKICHSQNKQNACCRHLPRCKRCRHVLPLNWHTSLCFICEQQKKAETHAKSDPATRRCRICDAILQSVFADNVCTRCAASVNVKGGVK